MSWDAYWDNEGIPPRSASAPNQPRTDREALEVSGFHPPPCNWAGGAPCTCPTRDGAAFDPETGEVFDSDAPDNGGWDKERHCATDLRGADWAGRKLREAQEQLKLNEAMYAEEQRAHLRKMDAARERYVAACAPFRESVAYFENALRVFAETHRDEVLKGLTKKSRLLPSGVTLGWRKTGGGLRLKEGEGAAAALKELIAWADRPEMPRALLRRSDPEPALNSIKAYAKAQNVTPPGMERAAVSEEVYVSTGIETKEGS